MYSAVLFVSYITNYIFLIVAGLLSVLGFVLQGLDHYRTSNGNEPLARGLMILGACLGSFGSLMGMLLFQNRLRDKLLLFLSIGFVVLLILLALFI